jgi:hypothetical protein
VVSELALLPSVSSLGRWDLAAAVYMLAAGAAVGWQIRSLVEVRCSLWPLAAARLKRLGLRPPAGWADICPGSETDRG